MILLNFLSVVYFLLQLFCVLFVFGVFSNGGFEALKNMVDSASIIITVGGSISGVLAAHKLP